MKEIHNIIIEGGGVRAIACLGSMYYLETTNRLSTIKNYAGSSGGAIVAAALAIGYLPSELKEIIMNTDLSKFNEISWNIIKMTYNLFKHYGFMNANNFYSWLGDLFQSKTGNKDITFKELYNTKGITLVLTGMCVNKRELHLYHHESNPNMSIRKAVRISMSLPFIFKPIKWNGDILIDGGTLNNYPLYVFDNDKLPNTKDSQFSFNHNRINEHSLGLKLLDNDEKDELLYTKDVPISNIVEFTSELISGILIRIEKLHVQENYWNRTIKIQTKDIKTIDFDLSSDQKSFLFDQGFNAAFNYFNSLL